MWLQLSLNRITDKIVAEEQLEKKHNIFDPNTSFT